MTEQALKDAGYHPYKPNHSMGDTWKIAYQRKFYRDHNGCKVIRYFVNVRIWHHQDRDKEWVGYEAMLNSNDGCVFFPDKAHIMVVIGCIHDWTVAQLEAAAREIHDRLETLDYERQE